MKATITYTPAGPRIDIEGSPEEVAVYTRGVMAGGALAGTLTPEPAAPRGGGRGNRKPRDPAAIEKQRQKMLAYWAERKASGGDGKARAKAK